MSAVRWQGQACNHGPGIPLLCWGQWEQYPLSANKMACSGHVRTSAPCTVKAPRRGLEALVFSLVKRGKEREDAGGGEVQPGMRVARKGSPAQKSAPRLWFWMTEGRQQRREAEGPALTGRCLQPAGDWSQPKHRTEVQGIEDAGSSSDPVLRAGGLDLHGTRRGKTGGGSSPSSGNNGHLPHLALLGQFHIVGTVQHHGSHGHCPQLETALIEEVGQRCQRWPGRCPGRCRRQACR